MSRWFRSGRTFGFVTLALLGAVAPLQHQVVQSASHLKQVMPSVAQQLGLTWRQVANMPEELARPAVATGRDGNIYVIGGISRSAPSNGTFIYHPHTNTWTEGANLPTAREGAQAITLPDGHIVVMGGEAIGTTGACTSDLCQEGTVFSTVEEYAPASNTWRTLAPLMTPRF